MESPVPIFNPSAHLIPLFNPSLHWHVGIEREYFLMSEGKPVPKSKAFLSAIYHWYWSDFVATSDWHYMAHARNVDKLVSAWTYEFSACQVEARTEPKASLRSIRGELEWHERIGRKAAVAINTELTRMEVAPADMPMDHSIDARYKHLAKVIPPDVLLAAFRVAGTHFHLGMSCLEEAIDVHDALCACLPDIIAMGDHSHGERIGLYHQVVSWAMPERYVPVIGTSPIYGSASGWLDYLTLSQVSELRSCWDLIRITPYGTVELRALGIAQSFDEILSWVESVFAMLGRQIP
jgi:hypothetical protein